jgi:hypothetical protein
VNCTRLLIINEAADLDPLVRIESLSGLVQDQEIGPMENGGREADPLAESLRELADGAVKHRLEASRGDRVIHGTPTLPGRQLPQARDEVQVFGDQHFDIERIVLRQVSDPALGLTASLVERDLVELDGARVRLDELGDHAHGSGFSGAVRAQESNNLPTIYLEGDLIDGGDAAEALGDAVEGE